VAATVEPQGGGPRLDANPRLRRLLAGLPTRPLRRVVWDRVKHWRRVAVVETAFGARMHCDTRDFIQRFVYFFGVWEPNLTAWLPRRLAPGDTFVDVGANVGYFTLLGAQAVGPTGRVVAVEAAPETRVALERNVALNGLGDVRTIAAAASSVRGTLVLVPDGEHNVGGTATAPVDAAPGGVRVPAAPLRELLTPAELARARVVKIDVEGAESDVLAGLDLGAGGLRDDLELVVEIAPDRLAERGTSAEALLEALRAQGFNTYALANDYRSRTYLHRWPLRRPVRFRGPLTEQGDVVFSRVDAETL
jgi:FkbM family methyltransferase